jgi:mannosyltransferase OCH1-like enzyme
MKEFNKLMVNDISNSPIWDMLETNFNKFHIKSENDINKIPKKIHQIWLGGKIPDKYKRLRDTFLEKNPNWEYKLWTDEDVNDFNLKNIDTFNKITNLGVKSDIFRYEILYREGGLYVDTDFECLKSFDDLTYLDLFTGTGHLYDPEVFNGLIACKKNHELIKELIDNIQIINTNNFDEILSLTGPRYFSDKLFQWIKNNPNDKVIVFPTNFFYPFPAVHRYMVRDDSENSRNLVQSFCTNDSYCVHLWYTSWQG